MKVAEEVLARIELVKFGLCYDKLTLLQGTLRTSKNVKLGALRVKFDRMHFAQISLCDKVIKRGRWTVYRSHRAMLAASDIPAAKFWHWRISGTATKIVGEVKFDPGFVFG